MGPFVRGGEMTVELFHGDCLDILPTLPDKSVDAIITDLPYGTTACKWDVIIPLVPMWEQVKRLLKERGAFVTTAQQPFTSALVASNLQWFKYEWIWKKSNVSGMMNAQYIPLSEHENILVFSEMRARANQFQEERMNYFPQGLQATHRKEKNKLLRESAINNTRGNRKGLVHFTTQTGFPKSILPFNSERGDHPTQKPVALYEYLIRTYTNEGDTVLDFCMGSGTTGCAAVRTNRNFIGIEREANYFEIAERRIAEAQQQMVMAL